MTKKIRKIVLFTIVTTLLTVTGCGDKKNTDTATSNKPAIAYIVANTANSKPVDSSAPIIQDTMIDCAENYGYSFIVRVDGEPELVSSENLDIDPQYKNAAKERLKRDATNKATNLLQVLEGVHAVNPESDYLEAIRLAAASLRSLDNSYTSRNIICCGSGLGTTGYLNFQNNLLSAESQTIVKLLQEKEALPDLSGITVYWIGMAQTTAPQEKLNPKQGKNLENIWKSVIEAAGGEFVPNNYISVSQNDDTTDELPSVSIVNIPSDDPIVFEPEMLEQPEQEEENAFEEPVILGESQIQFVGGKATYLDEESATETIRPIAEYLLNHTSVNLLLVGSTAGDITDESTLRLSQDRADTVKHTLVEFGVDNKRINTLGMGASDPWHISGAGYDETVGSAASSNRKVVLIDANTELAQQLMSSN